MQTALINLTHKKQRI